jgi:PKD repeat protein
MTPNADFSISASPFCAGVNITVTDASTDATSWTWNFGSGATPGTATGVRPHAVSYSTSGSKTISLTINGGASTASQTITVNGAPVLSGASSTCVGNTLTLTSSIVGGSWTSSNPSVATVTDGVVMGVGTAAGLANIFCSEKRKSLCVDSCSRLKIYFLKWAHLIRSA